MPKRNDIKVQCTIRNDDRETITIKLIGFDPAVLDGYTEHMPWEIAAAIDTARTHTRKAHP